MWQYGGIPFSWGIIGCTNDKESIRTFAIIFEILYPQCMLINREYLARYTMVMVGEVANVLLAAHWKKQKFHWQLQ